MTDSASPMSRAPLLGIAGAALGFAVAASAFLGPLGWAIAALLLAGLCWLMFRLEDQGGNLWIAVGISAAVGVLLYFGLALVQNLLADPSSDHGCALINGSAPPATASSL